MNWKEPVAAIDCGSNTVRLLIRDGVETIREMQTTRLGKQLETTGRLDPGSIELTLSTLEQYKKVMDDVGVVKWRGVATSAMRDAQNKEDLLVPAAALLGHELEVIDGDEEAALSYAGAIRGRAPGNYLLVDVGGGSTETVFGTERETLRSKSVDAGSVRMTERYFSGGPYSESTLTASALAVEPLLIAARDSVSPQGALAVGVAGTITTVAALVFGFESYVSGGVHNRVISRNQVTDLFTRFAKLTNDELRAIPGMPPNRADIIVGGLAVVVTWLAVFDVEELTISESDILDGMICGL